mmetsp:Transcript_44486/g.123091  ORF Transcript_44486/g.123091 Transcript_44486/m.123091 type:complete len:414 (-) Transcript_44486:593-1834(-)
MAVLLAPFLVVVSMSASVTPVLAMAVVRLRIWSQALVSMVAILLAGGWCLAVPFLLPLVLVVVMDPAVVMMVAVMAFAGKTQAELAFVLLLAVAAPAAVKAAALLVGLKTSELLSMLLSVLLPMVLSVVPMVLLMTVVETVVVMPNSWLHAQPRSTVVMKAVVAVVGKLVVFVSEMLPLLPSKGLELAVVVMAAVPVFAGATGARRPELLAMQVMAATAMKSWVLVMDSGVAVLPVLLLPTVSAMVIVVSASTTGVLRLHAPSQPMAVVLATMVVTVGWVAVMLPLSSSLKGFLSLMRALVHSLAPDLSATSSVTSASALALSANTLASSGRLLQCLGATGKCYKRETRSSTSCPSTSGCCHMPSHRCKDRRVSDKTGSRWSSSNRRERTGCKSARTRLCQRPCGHHFRNGVL